MAGPLLKKWFACLCGLLLGGGCPAGWAQTARPEPVALTASYAAAPICVDAQDAEVVRVAAEALAKDITQITSVRPVLRAATDRLAPAAAIVGTLGESRLIDQNEALFSSFCRASASVPA